MFVTSQIHVEILTPLVMALESKKFRRSLSGPGGASLVKGISFPIEEARELSLASFCCFNVRSLVVYEAGRRLSLKHQICCDLGISRVQKCKK